MGPPQTENAGGTPPIKRLIGRWLRERTTDAADEQLRLAFDQALIPLAILDLSSRMVRVNQSLCLLFGCSAEQLLGRTFQEFTHPEHRGDDVQPLQELMSGQRRVHVREKRYLRSDGTPIWAEVAVSMIRHGDGRPSHFVIQVQDITARRDHEAELRRMADQDPLTGLRNRRGFHERLTEHTAQIERYEPIGALLMIDLDHFKDHNDTHGHIVGDELLAAVASRIQSRLRVNDVIGRYGGDEFVVLLPDASREQAEVVAPALIVQVAKTELISGPLLDRPIGASIGVVCFADTGPLPASAALIFADRAMYVAKRAGGNRFVLHEPDASTEQLTVGPSVI